MRSVLSSVVVSGLVMGCSVFGAGESSSGQAPPPGTPQDNAQPPPVDGTPIPGVYVSTSQGSDEGTGTPARPLKTLKKAFALANEQHLRVIACAEVYEESVTLIDGVSAYGYYECAATPWKKGDRRAIVRAPTSPAVLAKGLRLPTRVEGFEIIAPDLDGAGATETTGSSIALEVRDSRELVFSGSRLHAGRGAPGADGVAGPPNTLGGSDAPPGKSQRVSDCPVGAACINVKVIGPPGAVTTCAIGPPGGPGGQGGDGRFLIDCNPNTNATELRGRPLVANVSTAVGGLYSGGKGLPGAIGTAGTDGVDGVNGTWSFSEKGFVRGSGTAGGRGEPGQGGGGGGGTDGWFTGGGFACPSPPTPYADTATGGGGGAGGCAGQPGTSATGGGASIGALVVGSGVTIEGTRLESSAGGRAGLGNLGGKGTFGGKPGAASNTATGSGGPGGPGGNGGASGHGAAGPSIALAYAGTRPLLTGQDLAPGEGGAGQPELRGNTPLGRLKFLPAAAPGSSEAEHEIK